jgi:SynChlorMet cassette radical SAM/SPASM protein ScmE
MVALLQLCRRYPGRISAQAGPLAEALQWTAMIKACGDGQPAGNGGGFLTGCGCPWNTIAVRSDGAYVPCTFLSHLVLGRINRDCLEKVWRENPLLNGLRRRREISLSSFDFCRECDFTSTCTGNCPGLAYSHTRIIDHPSPDACLKRFLDSGGKIPAEEGTA